MKKGFTLIELLIVVVIIGVMASITVIGLNSIRVKSRDAKRISDMRQIQSALEWYKNDNNTYPSAITAGQALVGAINSQTYMKQIPAAPGKNDGSCTTDNYEYTPDNSYTSYHINYCLGGAVQSAGPANCQAVPGSICNVSTSSGTASSTAWIGSGLVQNNTGVGTVAWALTNQAYDSDNSRTQVEGTFGTRYSNYLKATNFSLSSIPNGATITGIQVDIEKSAFEDGADYITDYVVRIVKPNGTVGTTNLAATSVHWPISDAYASYGGSTELWGESWTVGDASSTDIKDTDFGVVLSVTINGGSNGTLAYVDYIRLKVYYTY